MKVNIFFPSLIRTIVNQPYSRSLMKSVSQATNAPKDKKRFKTKNLLNITILYTLINDAEFVTAMNGLLDEFLCFEISSQI